MQSVVFGWLVGCSLAVGQQPAPVAHEPPCPPAAAKGVSRWAHPGRSPRETGGYVGGGCLLGPLRRGGAGKHTEGVWGWDYVGRGLWPHRIFLKWCGCRKRFPLSGYKTDGPPVPDIFAKPPHHEKDH